MNCSTPALLVHHQLPEFTQTHIHWVSDAIQPSHPLSSPSPPAPNSPHHQSLEIRLKAETLLCDKGPYRQSYGFSSSHVRMWESDHKEGSALKNWCFRTAVLEKTLESPLNCKEIKPVHLKGYRPWIFIGRTNAEAEDPILWPPDVKNWLWCWERLWCWVRLKAGGEGDNRGWDGCMASLTQWTWIWVNSRSWWWTGRPGVLRFMGSQRVEHNWATELNWRCPFELGSLVHSLNPVWLFVTP